MPIERISLGTISISGPEQNGWDVAIFFKQTAWKDIEAKPYLLDPGGGDISINGDFTNTKDLVMSIAAAVEFYKKDSRPDLSIIPESFIENEIAMLLALQESDRGAMRK